MKKLIALLLVLTLAVGLVACGGAAGVDKTYTVSYDNTLDPTVLEAVPSYQFNAEDMAWMIASGMSLDVELALTKDGNYTLTAKWYNVDPNAVEGDPGYMNINVVANGTYTIDGEQVTISAATTATATYEGGAYITEQSMFDSFSFAEDGKSTGTWTSEDVPEILECVPATVFTVSEDGAIVTWAPVDAAVAGNPHAAPADEAGESEADGAEDDSAETEVSAADSFSFNCDWVCTMVLNVDGTYKFELADYGITEEGTWAYADGVLTVTKPSGNTVGSTVDGETLKLDYVSDASDQLVGQFYSTDWKGFFESDDAETSAGDVISLSCDWVCTMVLNADGTYKFELADYGIVEEGTWAYADDVLTVTKPSGNTIESTIVDGVLHLDYVSDASEQLVGQFYSAEWETLFN